MPNGGDGLLNSAAYGFASNGIDTLNHALEPLISPLNNPTFYPARMLASRSYTSRSHFPRKHVCLSMCAGALLEYVRDRKAPLAGARLVCSCTRSDHVSAHSSQLGWQPHAKQECDMRAWDEREGAQFVTLHFHGPTQLLASAIPAARAQGEWSRRYLGGQALQHVSWFLWIVSASSSCYGGIEVRMHAASNLGSPLEPSWVSR